MESHAHTLERAPVARRDGRPAASRGRARSLVERRFPLWVEMTIVGATVGLWQLARIPLEGSLPVALAHAKDWFALERALHVDVEPALIRLAHHAGAVDALWVCYRNLHLAVLFGFMVLARRLAPDRYPRLRTAFVCSHVPAVVAIGLYPLLPPRWFPAMPFAVTPPPALNGGLHNATAAVASQHVGYPIFIAASTIWIARSRLAWLTLAYPAFVFLVVLGTGNHYTLDAVAGGLCAAFGFAVARLLHGRFAGARREPRAPIGPTLLAALGYAFFVRAIDTFGSLTLRSVTLADVLLVTGGAAIFAAWWWSRRYANAARSASADAPPSA